MLGVFLYILFLLTFNFKIAEDKVIAYLSITSNKTGKKQKFQYLSINRIKAVIPTLLQNTHIM